MLDTIFQHRACSSLLLELTRATPRYSSSNSKISLYVSSSSPWCSLVHVIQGFVQVITLSVENIKAYTFTSLKRKVV